MKTHRHRPIDEPAGPKRADAMARSKDALEAAGEERAKDAIAIDQAKLKPDREILRIIGPSGGQIDISNMDPKYTYCMCRSVPGDTRQVEQKLALQVETNRGSMATWEVVNGSMREMEERKTPEGTRRIGDCILLRCRKDVYLAIENWKTRQRALQMGSADADLEAFAHEQRGKIILHSNPEDPMLKRALASGYSNEMAMKRVTERLRTGTMPGAEMGR